MNRMDRDRPFNFPPQVSCCSSCRSPVHLVAVAQALGLGVEPRFQPEGATTFCATAAVDFCGGMGVTLPAVWGENGGIGTPLGPSPNAGGYRRLRANDLQDWLAGKDGVDFGWMVVDELSAIQRASSGFPTLVTFKNPGGEGHIAGVLPSSDGRVIIFQAGKRSFYAEPLEAGFGADRKAIPVKFFSHQ